jgi:protein-tyrosine phosphatase
MKILMVCLGNICRSPLAEGILKKKIAENRLDVIVDSAGTGGWHVGEPPDHRATAVAKKFGVDISKLSCRKFFVNDFDDFDKIFVMDQENFRDVMTLTRNSRDKEKVQLILNVLADASDQSVPDPYYGGEEEFVNVFRLLDKACEAIVNQLKQST